MARDADNLVARVAELESLVGRLEARLGSYETQLARKDKEIALKDGLLIDQIERIAELEKALEDAHRRSKRQTAPFSKGDPKPEPKRPGRKPGEAHGRHGHRRVPLGPPDRDLDAPLPERCPHCGDLVDHERDDEQWQTDVPEVRPTTTRFTVGVGRCRGCRRRIQGRHPEQTSDALGAAGSQIGPVLKGWAMWLHYRMGLSFGRTAEVLARLGINVTAGAICRSSAHAARTELVPVHADLVARANRSKAITMDETGWRVGGRGAWLWVAANDEITLCWVGDGRSFAQATEVIDAEYDGVVVRDGYVVYNNYIKATHQSCVAHLLRRCSEMEGDLPRPDRKIPLAAKAILADALAARDLPGPDRAAAAAELADRLDVLVARPVGHDANRRLLKHLANQAPHLFTFLTIDGVDATNFQGEQAVRPCAVNRKTWGGNRTWNGARTHGTIVSVIATARKHGIDAVEYLANRARGPDPGLAVLLG
jgi:transposase